MLNEFDYKNLGSLNIGEIIINIFKLYLNDYLQIKNTSIGRFPNFSMYSTAVSIFSTTAV